MFPPIFPTIAASSAVKAIIGGPPNATRFYQFGMAQDNVQYPYAVWRRVFGAPENYLGDVPGIDQFTIQVDCYAKGDSAGANTVRNLAAAIRDAIEPVSYITNWLGESIDPETKSHTFTFQCDWYVNRP